MVDIKNLVDASPWHPITDPVSLKHLGKLSEELNECGAAVARCIIQGVDEKEPITGKINRDWLRDEMSDVIANIELVLSHFNMSLDFVRIHKKKDHLKSWHRMA